MIQEQNKIAYFFNKLDKLIEKQSSKVELLKQRKQGFYRKCLFNSYKVLLCKILNRDNIMKASPRHKVL